MLWILEVAFSLLRIELSVRLKNKLPERWGQAPFGPPLNPPLWLIGITRGYGISNEVVCLKWWISEFKVGDVSLSLRFDIFTRYKRKLKQCLGSLEVWWELLQQRNQFLVTLSYWVNKLLSQWKISLKCLDSWDFFSFFHSDPHEF